MGKHDLAKCAANRDKDREFNVALLRAGIVDEAVARSRVQSMTVDASARQRIESLIGGFVETAKLHSGSAHERAKPK